jgi:hypothetical protein
MKRITYYITIATLILINSHCLSAGEKETKKVESTKFKVTINVTYNAVTSAEAAQIVKEVSDKHEKACSLGVKVENVESMSIGSLFITTTPGIASSSSGTTAVIRK